MCVPPLRILHLPMCPGLANNSSQVLLVMPDRNRSMFDLLHSQAQQCILRGESFWFSHPIIPLTFKRPNTEVLAIGWSLTAATWPWQKAEHQITWVPIHDLILMCEYRPDRSSLLSVLMALKLHTYKFPGRLDCLEQHEPQQSQKEPSKSWSQRGKHDLCIPLPCFNADFEKALPRPMHFQVLQPVLRGRQKDSFKSHSCFVFDRLWLNWLANGAIGDEVLPRFQLPHPPKGFVAWASLACGSS